MFKHNELQGQVIFELGSGLGYTGVTLQSLGLGRLALNTTIYLTDHQDDILQLANKNIHANSHATFTRIQTRDSDSPCINIHIRHLDWSHTYNPRNILSHGSIHNYSVSPSSSSPPSSFVWTAADTAHLTRGPVTFLAADVIYDDVLTNHFFATAARLMRPREVLWLSLEKRFNFTIHEASLVAHGYNEFLRIIGCPPSRSGEDKEDGRGGESNITRRCFHTSQYESAEGLGRGKEIMVCFTGRRIPLLFPQTNMSYDRCKDIELWEIELNNVPP